MITRDSIPFSIILPVLNGELLLSRALHSIQAQSLHDWECWIVNDGSTDGTQEIIDRIIARDSRFHSIQLERNHGLSAARNLGIRHAAGDWIAELDHDDELDPHSSPKSSRILADPPKIRLTSIQW